MTAKPLLVIGNKKYSSWSLRAWIGLTMAGVDFEEKPIAMYRPETPAEMRRYSPTALVPTLVDGDLTVHESLAILEYVNEAHAAGSMLPAQRKRRALARAVCAEMHSGFAALRARLPMNMARAPGPTSGEWAIDAATQEDITRILSMWEELLTTSEGPYLFGEWSMADCMYLPVATRFCTYAVDTSGYPASGRYIERVLALPAFARWQAAGRAEPQEHPPYDR